MKQQTWKARRTGWLGLVMIALALFVAVAVSPTTTAQAQWQPRHTDESIFADLTRRSENFVQYMIRNDSVSMRREMSEETRATLTTAAIDRIYANILRAGGRVREIGTPVIQNADELVGMDYDEDTPVIIDVPIHLASNSVTGRITFERKTPLAPITGFAIRPYEGEVAPDGRGYTRAEQFSRPPLYADRNLFRETETMINSGDLALPARVTTPLIAGENSRVPGVVLIAGAEPADMDLAHNTTAPFRDIAQGLATRGVAVLRYTNRSQIAGTSEDTEMIPTANNVIVSDAVAAVEAMRALPQVDPNRITLVGYRVGGMLAPLVAEQVEVERVVMLNPPTPPMDRYIRSWVLAQQDSWDRLDHESWEVVDGMLDSEEPLTAAQLLAAKPLIHQPPIFWQDVRRLDMYDVLSSVPYQYVVLLSDGDATLGEEPNRYWWSGPLLTRTRSNSTVRLLEGLDERFIPLEEEAGRRNVSEELIDRLELLATRGRMADQGVGGIKP